MSANAVSYPDAITGTSGTRDFCPDSPERSDSGEFEIHARSCTLARNNSNPDLILWRVGTCYRIPIFQRPYSWGETEVKRLLNDLLMAFFGRNGRSRLEQMFIGTMQLSRAEAVTGSDFTTRHDIIDGQQRLTTLTLLFRSLQRRAPEAPIWRRLDFPRRLTTAVSGGIQQDYFARTLADGHDDDEPDRELNVYARNLQIIEEHLLDDDEFLDSPELSAQFAEYLSSRVYFVIIETHAPLSKTLQIFDAINTSGMDLDGGDVFKIRYYEYLRERRGAPESVFAEICALYERIDRENEKRGRKLVEIGGVLSLAQQILITDYGLSNETRNLAGTTFFERLLDVILGIQQWENFPPQKCERVTLTLGFFNELVDASFAWEDIFPKLRPEAHAMCWFIWWSRYGRYYFLPTYFLHRFRDRCLSDSGFKAEFEDFIIGLAKLLIIYSLRFQRVTNEGHQKARALMNRMASHVEQVRPSDMINHLTAERMQWREHLHERLLFDEFADIPKAKNLVCRLDAMFSELDAGHSAEALGKLLFESQIDVEHIESANHRDGAKREAVQQEWGSELHQLGNLILLEYDLNRSISNADYATIKRARYESDSGFRVVKAFSRQNPIWTRELARKRRKALAEKLTDYLCGLESATT